MILKVNGSNSRIYEIDTDRVTCSCSNFIYKKKSIPMDDPGRLCKHLRAEVESKPELFPSIVVKNLNIVTETENSTGILRSEFNYLVSVVRDLIKSSIDPETEVFDVTGDYRLGLPRIDCLDILIGLTKIRGLQFNKTLIDLLRVDVNYVTETLCELTFKSDGYKLVRLHTVPIDEFPFQQLFMTGSKEEIVELINKAFDKKMILSKEGLMGCMNPIKTESDIYKELGIPYPIMRSNFDTMIEKKSEVNNDELIPF